MGQTTIPDRQHTLEKASTIPSLHGKFTCSGHGVVFGCYTFRTSTNRLRWLDLAAPLQPHAVGRLRPAEITLFPPLIDGDALLDYSHSSTIIV
jgi:hypothetical protein